MKEPIRILLLEDNADDVELIKRLLRKEQLNCEFRLAIDRETYLQALDEFHPAIILSDHSMPVFNSEDAYIIACQRFPDTAFIMVTGTVSEEYAAQVIKMGMDDYVLKDRMARLPAAITSSLQHRKYKKERREADQRIIQSETNLRIIFENTSEGFLLMDNEGIIKAFNGKATQYVLVSKVNEFRIGDSVFDFIEPWRKEIFAGLIQKVLKGESIRYDRSYEIENGKTACIDFSITPALENDQVRGICITGRDITERKKAEKTIADNEEKYRTLVEQAFDSILIYSKDFIILDCNYSACRSLGYSREELKAHSVTELFFKEDLQERPLYFETLNQGQRTLDYRRLRKKDGTSVEMEIGTKMMPDGNLMAIARDITERKKAEENLKLLEEKIQEQKIQEQKKIARAIIKAQENERNRIGQELHDNINQILVSTKLYLGMAGNDQNIKELIKYPLELLDTSINEIRLLSSELVTPVRNINLEEMVKKILDKFEQNTNLKTEFVYSGSNESIPDDIKLNIYRILQEQLNNITKHAEAKKVFVSMQSEGNLMNVLIEDDGKGFDLTEKRKGIGLLNMANRIESFNGKVQIESSPGNGCRIALQVPYF